MTKSVELGEVTIGEVARRLGQPIHRIAYVVRAREITVVRTVARYRIFDEAAIRQIRAAIERIDSKKGGDQ